MSSLSVRLSVLYEQRADILEQIQRAKDDLTVADEGLRQERKWVEWQILALLGNPALGEEPTDAR